MLEEAFAKIKDKTQQVKQHAAESADFASVVLYETVRKHAALTDHSLQDLAKMGHPYSTKQSSGPHPDYDVHMQSGNLYENIEREVTVTDDKITISVGVDASKVPYIGYLIEGTSKMRARPLLDESWVEGGDKVKGILKNGMAPGLGSRNGVVGR